MGDNSIGVLVLSTGESLLGRINEVTSAENGNITYEVESPLLVGLQQSGQLMMAPYLPFVNSKIFTFAETECRHRPIYNIDQRLADKYLEFTSGIQLAPANSSILQ